MSPYVVIFEEPSVYVLRKQHTRSTTGSNAQLNNSTLRLPIGKYQISTLEVRGSKYGPNVSYPHKLVVVFCSRYRKLPEWDLD
jgi:hypothetical protein